MVEHPACGENEKLIGLEQQIVDLYTRHLFLRQDELEVLQEAARAVDTQAARSFLLSGEPGSPSEEIERGTLFRLIERFRQLQTQRQSDAKRLANLREQALFFHEKYSKKNRLMKWWFRFNQRRFSERSALLYREGLKIDLESAEIRHQTALNMLAVIVGDLVVKKGSVHGKSPLHKFVAMMNYRERLRKRKQLYIMIMTNLRSDVRVVKLKGGL